MTKRMLSLMGIGFIAAVAVTTSGCGSSSSHPVLAYVQRVESNSYNPALFKLDPKTAASTPVSITLNTAAEFVFPNADATAVTYCRESSSEVDDIFYIAVGGQEKQLTTNADACLAAISPDGKTIAYQSCSGLCAIYLMNIDGSNQRALVSTPGYTQSAPWFSPDSTMLSFYVQSTGDDSVVAVAGPFGDHGASKWFGRGAKSSGGNAARGNVQPQTPSYEAGWYVATVASPNPTLVYATANAFIPSPFTSDGKSLLISEPVAEFQSNVVSANVDGSGATNLAVATNTINFGAIDFDGQIYFNQFDLNDSGVDIFSMTAAGAGQASFLASPANTYNYLIDAGY